jgi:hypothetical protein
MSMDNRDVAIAVNAERMATAHAQFGDYASAARSCEQASQAWKRVGDERSARLAQRSANDYAKAAYRQVAA